MKVQSQGWKDTLEESTATSPNILDWRIPWTEEPGGYSPQGSQRIGHNWASKHHPLLALVSAEKPVVNLIGILLYVLFPLLLLIFFSLSLIFINSNWCLCVLECSSLGLSCLGLSVLPGLGWLFPFPVRAVSSYYLFRVFSQVLSLSLLLLGPL